MNRGSVAPGDELAAVAQLGCCTASAQLGDGLLDLGGGRGADVALADQLVHLALELGQLLGRLLALALASSLLCPRCPSGRPRGRWRGQAAWSSSFSACWSAVPCWRAVVITAVRLASAAGTRRRWRWPRGGCRGGRGRRAGCWRYAGPGLRRRAGVSPPSGHSNAKTSAIPSAVPATRRGPGGHPGPGRHPRPPGRSPSASPSSRPCRAAQAAARSAGPPAASPASTRSRASCSSTALW